MSDTCNAPGPGGMECAGASGHAGLHGHLDNRWNDEEAEHAAALTYGPEQVPGTLEVRGFRGRVWQRLGPKLVPWRGVCVMDDTGVTVELVGQQTIKGVQLDLDTTSVILPWAVVAMVEIATDELGPAGPHLMDRDGLGD